MRPRLLDKLTQVRNEVFIVERRQKFLLLPPLLSYVKGATPSRQAASAPRCIIVTLA